MYKAQKIVIVFVLIINYAYSQTNLIQNPSFETYTACPSNTGGDVYKAVGWDNAKNTPDYFHECGSNSAFKTPLNLFGYQTPVNGKAYSGFYTHDASTPNYRELIIGTLISPMLIGQKYYVSYKVSRADSNYNYRYNTNNLGARFTKTKYNLGFPNYTNTLMDNLAHINVSYIIGDTLNWVKIKGSYIADSAYKYIILGNFFDASNTNVFDTGVGLGNIAYYYIDEVCVTTDSLYNEGYVTSLAKNAFAENSIKVYPNPFNDKLIIDCEVNSEIKIFTPLGEIYFETKLPYKNSTIINTTNWQQGFYIIKLNNQCKLIIKNL